MNAPAPTRTKVRELLRQRDLRTLLSAQWTAQAADGLAQAAFAEALILGPLGGETPGRILLVFAITLVPYSLLAPLLGVFVDRWRRRELMVATNVARAAVLVTLPLWAELLPRDAALYAAVLVVLGLGRLFLVTKGAVLPVVLEEHHLLRGNALSSGGGMIAALLGGVVGVGIVGWLGPRPSFAAAGVAYAVAAAIARRISRPFAHPHPPDESVTAAAARVVRELAAGVREIARRPRARIPLAAIFVLRTIGMIVAIAAILVIKSEFPDAGDRFGRLSSSALALGSAGAGAFAGAVTAPLVGRRLAKPGLVVSGFVVSGVGIAALGGWRSIPAVLALTAIGGYGGFLTKVAVDAQVQEALPDEYRGRAFSLYDILYNLASVAAAAVMVLGQDVSLRPMFAGTGIVTLALAAAFAAVMARHGMRLAKAGSPLG
ncbi:MAG TPA: MFS transporter [Actinomycetota bacterium]|nr:MFS transporter [Actinomycetota bacterium]